MKLNCETQISFTSEDHSGFFWDICCLVTGKYLSPVQNKDFQNVVLKGSVQCKRWKEIKEDQ